MVFGAWVIHGQLSKATSYTLWRVKMAKRKALIRLRGKPKKPVRIKNYTYRFTVWDGYSAKDVVDWAEAFNVPLDQVLFEKDYYDDEHAFIFCGEEPEGIFDKRVEEYAKKLKSYNEWYAKNKYVIEEEKALRKVEKADKKEKKKAKLQAEIAKLEKEMSKL